MSEPSCWVLTDGKAGTENQCIGLAEAIGLDPLIKRARPRPPWTWMPVRHWPMPFQALPVDGGPLAPPWPDLLIASGRRSIPYALAIKRASGAATLTVQIQDPRVPTRLFDLVVPPRHDHVRGANVLETRGALHRITPARLSEAAARGAASYARLARPLIAVLIGGSSHSYRMTRDRMHWLGERLAVMAAAGAGLAVTASRRTSDENMSVLHEALAGTAAEIWNGVGENPYFAFLGLADAIVVTCDSVSMTSEACSTGKPVYVVELVGGSRKFQEFHEGLRADGLTRPFTGVLDHWSYAPLRDTEEVATEVRRCLGLAEHEDGVANRMSGCI